jgi:hypothetical protein
MMMTMMNLNQDAIVDQRATAFVVSYLIFLDEWQTL